MGDQCRQRFLQILCAGAVVILCIVPRQASAEPAGPKLDPDTREALERYAGTYTYAQEHDHGRAIVKRAMNEALTQIPRIFRPLVRRHLEKRDYFVTSFSIRRAGDRVAFRAQSYKVLRVSTYPGVTRELVSKKGRVTKVTHLLRDGHFEQILENRRGKQHSVLTLINDDNTMHVQTTFTSRYLDSPIRFELVYDRVQPRRRPPQKARPRPRQRQPRKVQPRREHRPRKVLPRREQRRDGVPRPGVLRVRTLRVSEQRRPVLPVRQGYRNWKRLVEQPNDQPTENRP
jgi:hypothetical protein